MKTIWIKDINDKSGWPYFNGDIIKVDGLSTSDNDTPFDAAMRQAEPEDTVYVGPGTFLTRGICGSEYPRDYCPGWRMQSGMKLIGSGQTSLKLVGCNDNGGGVVVGNNVNSNAVGMVVSDLTIDCNAPEITKAQPNAHWYIQGVQLWSNGNCHIERVHVKNAVAIGRNGQSPKTECFILCINTQGNSVDNLISHCTVSDFYNPWGNGACSAISMNCWTGQGTISGIIEDCCVRLNGERGWGFGGEFAYNLSNADNLIIYRCKSYGAQRGFNNDTHPNVQLTLRDNYFDMPPGVCVGVLLLKPNMGSYFRGNTIILRSNNACGFQIEKAGSAANLHLHNNRIIAVGAWPGEAYAFNMYSNFKKEKVPLGVNMTDNEVLFNPASPMKCLLMPEIGYMSGNKINGADWLWSVAQENTV